MRRDWEELSYRSMNHIRSGLGRTHNERPLLNWHLAIRYLSLHPHPTSRRMDEPMSLPPLPCLIICFAACLKHNITPLTLTDKMRSQSSSVAIDQAQVRLRCRIIGRYYRLSTRGTRVAMPALATIYTRFVVKVSMR